MQYLMQYCDIFSLKVAKINIKLYYTWVRFSLHYISLLNRQIGVNSLTWKLFIFL